MIERDERGRKGQNNGGILNIRTRISKSRWRPVNKRDAQIRRCELRRDRNDLDDFKFTGS